MADNNKHQFVIINGRQVKAQPRRSLDGLSLSSANPSLPASTTRTMQTGQTSRPKPVQAPRSLRGTYAPVSRPQTATTVHHKQLPSVRRKKPAPNIVFVDTPSRPASDHAQHRLPQSAALTEARAHRAHHFRQSSKISRYGSLRALNNSAQYKYRPSPETMKLATAVVANTIPQAGLPAQPRTINQHIAEHQSRLQESMQRSQAKTPAKRGLFSSRPLVSLTASALAVTVLLGYATYLNTPNLAMRVAASRAGIEAVMPGYQPSGFALNGPIEYHQGQVALNFKSNADTRNFTLTQQQSSWDSGSLLENYVTEKAAEYESIQKDGLTIYIFNGDDAAWVNRGLLFTVDGESLLDQEQLARLATSL